jgi:hypothetical protein
VRERRSRKEGHKGGPSPPKTEPIATAVATTTMIAGLFAGPIPAEIRACQTSPSRGTERATTSPRAHACVAKRSPGAGDRHDRGVANSITRRAAPS